MSLGKSEGHLDDVLPWGIVVQLSGLIQEHDAHVRPSRPSAEVEIDPIRIGRPDEAIDLVVEEAFKDSIEAIAGPMQVELAVVGHDDLVEQLSFHGIRIKVAPRGSFSYVREVLCDVV